MEKICSGCGRIVERLAKVNPNLCKNCYNKTYKPPQQPCSVCGDIKSLHTSNPPLCRKCYYDALPDIQCYICGNIEKFYCYDENQNPICHRCGYKKKIIICSICNEKKEIHSRIKGNPICQSCYDKYYKKIIKCSICGQYDISKGHCKDPNGKKKPICIRCYKAPPKTCSKCKKLRPVAKYINNEPFCISCYKAYRLKNDEKFAIISRLRNRLRRAFNHFSSKGKAKTADEYGINYKAICEYLGPCPGERKEWHIDHIVPLNAFDFNNPEDIKKAFAPENHQWLPAKENMKKGGRI